MTMPKKGTRKININGTEYKYRVRARRVIVEEKVVVKKDDAVVTIELPNGNYLSKSFAGGVTPQKIKDYISLILPEGWPKK